MRIRLIFTLILFIFTSLRADADGGINCSDWLGGSQALCSRDTHKSCNQNGLVSGVCRHMFPTRDQRIKIVREGAGKQEKFHLFKQWCGILDLFDLDDEGKAKCQRWWFGWPIDTWYRTSHVEYNYAEIGSVKSLEDWSTCLEEIQIGDDFKHGGSNASDRPQVCAYITTMIPRTTTGECTVPLVNWSYALIGCVERANFDMPGTYNLSLIDTSWYVDTRTPVVASNNAPSYVQMGSSFRYPMIKILNNLSSDDIKLYYKFPDDETVDDKKQCQSPNDNSSISFCAKVPSHDPSIVCACKENLCDQDIFIGCVPRPNLEQSNMSIIVEYNKIISEDGSRTAPAAAIKFVDLGPSKQLIDSAGNAVIKAADGLYYKYNLISNSISNIAAEIPIINIPLHLPKQDGIQNILGEMIVVDPTTSPSNDEDILKTKFFVDKKPDKQYSLAKDIMSVYGLDLQSTIAKTDATGKPLEIQITGKMIDQNCRVFKMLEQGTNGIKTYVSAGLRDRADCCNTEDSETVDDCLKRAQSTSCDYITENHDPEAVQAFCPGLYIEPETPTTIDQICVYANSWKNFISDQQTEICSGFLPGCTKISIPSNDSGYATWPAQIPSAGELQTGVCEASHNFEPQMIVTIQPVDLPADQNPTAAEAERQKMTDYLAELQSYYNNLQLNIPSSLLVSGSYYKMTESSCNPTRKCSNNKQAGQINCPCVRRMGCNEIKAASGINGFATWSAFQFPENTVDEAQQIVNGTCPISLDNSISTRACKRVKPNHARFNDQDPEYYIQYWDSVQGQCPLSNQQSNNN